MYNSLIRIRERKDGGDEKSPAELNF